MDENQARMEDVINADTDLTPEGKAAMLAVYHARVEVSRLSVEFESFVTVVARMVGHDGLMEALKEAGIPAERFAKVLEQSEHW